MTDKLAEVTADLSQFPRIVILRLRNMTAIDATGLHAIEVLNDRPTASGRTLILCGAREQPAALLEQAEFIEDGGNGTSRRTSRPRPRANEIRADATSEAVSGR